MKREMQDLSHVVGVTERAVLNQQKGNTVLPLGVRVPMGAAGEWSPAAPHCPSASIQVVGSKADAAAPVLCLANYYVVAENVHVAIRLSTCFGPGLADVLGDAMQNLPLTV